MGVIVNRTTRAIFLKSTAGISLTALASCASPPGGVNLLAAQSGIGNPSGKRPMTIGPDGANYTSTHDSNGNSYLYRNNVLIAQLSTDIATCTTTTFYFYPTNFVWKMNPAPAQITPSTLYTPGNDGTVSFSDSYTSKFTSNSSGNGNYNISSDGSQGTLFNSKLWSTPQQQTYSNSGGGGHCSIKCYAPAAVSASCVVACVFAVGATALFVANVVEALSNPLFGMFQAGILCAEHGMALATITDAISKCAGG